MNTDASFDTEAEQAIQEVRSDNSDVKYAICGHVDGKPNHIGLIATGTDTEELAGRMDPAENFYALARYETVFDMSTTIKFVYFVWIGEKVSFVKKGRYGVIQGSILEHFQPFHVQIATSTTEDIKQENVMLKLMETSGTKSKVLEDSVDSRGRQYQMRGFTQTQLPQRAAKSSFGVSAVATKGADVEVAPEVYEAVSKVRKDEFSETWMVAAYSNCNPTGPIVCLGSGSGGLQELKECMDDSLPMYALYRVTHTDENEITQVRFIYISYVGSKIKPTVKAKIMTHKGIATDIFTPAHVMIQASELSDIDEKDIMQKIEKQAAH